MHHPIPASTGRDRCDGMMVEAEGICLDYCRQKVTKEYRMNFSDPSSVTMIQIQVNAKFPQSLVLPQGLKSFT